VLQSPCSEELFGHFSGGTITNLLLESEDLFPFPPELQRPQVVETHENPILSVKDLGNHTKDAGIWNLNSYHNVEVTMDRPSVPVIVAEECWCKGNSKAPISVAQQCYSLSVSVVSSDQVVRPCRKSKCPSIKGKVAEITASSQLLDLRDANNDSKVCTEIKVRVLCIPKHHNKSESIDTFSLVFELKDSNGCRIGSDKLDIRKITANRSKKRDNQDFRKAPLVFVFVFLTSHITFRTNWRSFQR